MLREGSLHDPDLDRVPCSGAAYSETNYEDTVKRLAALDLGAGTGTETS